MEAIVAGVTTAGVYAYINDIRGLAYLAWLLITGISMMRVKREALAPTPVYGG